MTTPPDINHSVIEDGFKAVGESRSLRLRASKNAFIVSPQGQAEIRRLIERLHVARLEHNAIFRAEGKSYGPYVAAVTAFAHRAVHNEEKALARLLKEKP